MTFFKTLIIAALALTAGFGSSVAISKEDTVRVIHENMWEDYNKYKTDSAYYGLFDRPMIEVFSGSAKESINGFDNSFLDLGNIELRLGESTKKKLSGFNNIIKQNDNFIFLGLLKSDYAPSKSEKGSKLETSSLRFGLGSTSGYGYRLGEEASLLLYHTSGLVWTKTEFKDKAVTQTTNNSDQKTLDNFGNSVRFGTFYEAGVNVQLADFIGVKAAYERSIVFQRHMFWYWLGSELTEGIGQGLIDAFITPITRAYPHAAPIINFVLKNGLSYGMYELRKKNMNWPISTVAPFVIDQFKLGANLTF